jgi:replicative DNA helicase
MDTLPPHAPAAEQGVIGCILRSPSECLDGLDERGVQPEWFYDLRHQLIFHTARALHFRTPRVVVDFITLYTELQHLGHLDNVGGAAYLNQCQDAVDGVAALRSYVDLVREQWQLRSAVATLTDARDAIASGELAVDEALDRAAGALQGLSELHTHRPEQKIKEVMARRVIPKLEAHYTRGRAQMSGLVTTGLEYLDKIFCGLGGDNGNYHVFAARPNVGKTSLITGMALHAALDFEFVDEVTEEVARAAGELGFTTKEGKFMVKRKGVPVGISSLEMSAESLGQKMLFQRARADLQRWRTGYATDADFPPLLKANADLCAANNILIDDTARENIASIKAKWRRWHRQYGVRFFMLDYIQLIKSSGKQFRNDRVQEMEEISAELQALGKELNCPMAILAQLNRDYEKEPNRLPRLSDLKNCGAIEQDADSVTLLYKPSSYKPFSKEPTPEHEFFMECMEKKFGANWRKWDARPERINALVEKNKHGPKGDAKLLFLKSSTLFLDYTAWLKEQGFKQAAKGEESRYRQETIDPEDVP